MAKEGQDPMTNSHLLSEKAYKNTTRLEKRKALYQYTFPNYIIEDVVIDLLHIEKNSSLLDVGCGTGSFLMKAAERYPNTELVGLDISTGMLKSAKKKAIEKGLNINFTSGDVQNIQFPNDFFDKVTAMHMLYHAGDIHKALTEIARVLKPKGLVLITANSSKSRQELGLLKSRAAIVLGREVFTDPNMRFNLEQGLGMVSAHFKHVHTTTFESTLRLTESQPYVDYFDSIREFWQPSPTDKEWLVVLDLVRKYIELQIKTKGAFTDITGFGVIIGSNTI